MIFDLSQRGIPENSRVWVILAIKRKVLLWCCYWWKYLFMFSFMWRLISPSNSEKLSVVWGLTKDSVSLCDWKYFFTISRYLLKISTAKYIFVTFFFFVQTVTFDLSQIGFCENKKNWGFWGLTKETLSLLSRRKFFSIDRYLL